MNKKLEVGVLALQGDFRNHLEALKALGKQVIEVRTPAQLEAVSYLIMPGGESTAMSKLLESSGLYESIEKRLADDSLNTFGTCAGMIISASKILDGIPEQRSFGHFNATVRRNGIGRQIASFETDVKIASFPEDFRAIFIRPPVVEEVGNNVEVLAWWNESPILCRQGKHLFATFHPELTTDTRIHNLFFERF